MSFGYWISSSCDLSLIFILNSVIHLSLLLLLLIHTDS